MTVTDPVYRFRYTGLEFELRGQDQVRSLYRMWAETNQGLFFPEHEEVAVADHFVATFATAYQQVLGKGQRQAKFLSYLPSAASSKLLQRELGKSQHHADSSDMFLYKTKGILICPYDDRGRLAGEEVWEPEPSEAELIKLDPADVLTTEEAAKVLAPLIKPLPPLTKQCCNVNPCLDKASRSVRPARRPKKSPSRSTACFGFWPRCKFSRIPKTEDEVVEIPRRKLQCRMALLVNLSPQSVPNRISPPTNLVKPHFVAEGAAGVGAGRGATNRSARPAQPRPPIQGQGIPTVTNMSGWFENETLATFSLGTIFGMIIWDLVFEIRSGLAPREIDAARSYYRGLQTAPFPVNLVLRSPRSTRWCFSGHEPLRRATFRRGYGWARSWPC
jgi:hypothetical protein